MNNKSTTKSTTKSNIQANMKSETYKTNYNLEDIIKSKAEKFRKLRQRQFPLKKFNGSGIYALYYNGSNELYKTPNVHNTNSQPYPIFIGRTPANLKANELEEKKKLTSLYQKIKEQARSIEEAKNLDIQDFTCKCMLLEKEEVLLSEAIEAHLVNKYRPTWNSCIEGFANHNPGKGRSKQAPSEWDVVHPGRNWAKKLKGYPKNKKSIRKKLQKYMEAL